MSSKVPPSGGFSPDDALPPVEPPTAGFILTLFLVPGIVVAVPIMIWLLFNWLAHKGNDPDAFVQALSRNNEARWQAAFNLANALRAERGSKSPRLTGDSQLALQLAGILDREIDRDATDENSVTLRIYLCRALGEFKVTDGLKVLIKAATNERDKDEANVRRAALEGIAILASNVGGHDEHFSDNEPLRDALFKAAEDPQPRTRAAAAVAMGVIGGSPFVEKLRVMTEDTSPDVRYNAATRLAHLGDIAAVPGLAEMLDPNESAGVDAEPEIKMRPLKRALITINALRATGQLAEANRAADLSTLKAAVVRLLDSGTTGDIRVEATDALRQLNARAEAATE
jgi:HEAT repeat protein